MDDHPLADAPATTGRRVPPEPTGPGCPVESAIELVGGKWRLLILRKMLVDGPQRFNELS